MSNTSLIQSSKSALTDAAQALANLEKVRKEHEFNYHIATLPIHLKEGLHCLKAHVVFCIQDPKKRGALKGKKSSSRRDELSTEGFEGWLATNCPWLKKGAAYKYMTALKGLGLSELNTEDDVEEAIQQNLRIGPVSLTSLVNAAVEAIAPPAPTPPNLQQSEFEFLKQGLTAFREETEHLLLMKDQLKQNPDFHRAATGRLYAALVELTGTNWAPSDEPDALANVDPDSITL